MKFNITRSSQPPEQTASLFTPFQRRDMKQAFDEALSVQNAARTINHDPLGAFAAQQPAAVLHPLHDYLTNKAPEEGSYNSYFDHGVNRTVYGSANKIPNLFESLLQLEQQGYDVGNSRLEDAISSNDNTSISIQNSNGREEKLPLKPSQALKIAFILADFKTWQQSRPQGGFNDYLFTTQLLSKDVKAWYNAMHQHGMQQAESTTQPAK